MNNITERKISLVSMGAGNMKALMQTLDSFKYVVDEFVFGDLIIFPEDRKVLYDYEKEYNLRIIELPFNYIYQMGFSSVLNYLISNAKNDLCIYMNVSEVIGVDYGINEIVNNNPDCNTFYFSHAVEKHRWFRCSDRRELQWSGRLHEEPRGVERPYHKPIFQMADTEKDMDNPFKASVLNSLKEAVYFNQLIKIVDNPRLKEATHEYWLEFARKEYDSMKERMKAKGKQIDALETCNFGMFWEDIHTSKYFEETQFVSSTSINFQGARKDVL